MTASPKQLVEKVAKEPLFLARMLGYDKVKTSIHEEWIRSLWTPGDDSIQAHRGSYKTTCNVVGVIWGLIFRPETRILIIRKSYEEAVATVNEIKQHYERGWLRKFYKTCFGIDDPRDMERWKAGHLALVTKKNITKEANIECAGTGKQRTGAHYDLIIPDDIISVQDRVSKAERESVKLYCRELVNIINPGRYGIKYRGTPWHKDDAWTILPEPKRYPISMRFIDEFTDEEIEKRRSKMTASLFAANYDLKHIADENRVFDDPIYQEWPEELQTIGYLDPAYSGENHTSLAVGGMSNGEIFATGRTWFDSVENHYNEILNFCKAHNCGTLYVEQNADKGLSARDLYRIRGGLVQTVHESENKHIRISFFVKKNWYRLKFKPGTDPEFMTFLLDYQERLEPDDEADAMAGLIRRLTNPQGRQRVRYREVSL